ncbi:hypothetical protein BAUCODRAFT_79132 [Baudoinia panamericana UAMH 10762]|uniref:Phospholipid/glycerol acyltransferase domain-containing protein n=1 Tax=Baudoinia panamericana (strain UAMH 10762) TaxID=717646 RepID=M2LCI7_BAUPA|nr:uncharacterized protein BAUCODRAFT_79132 [Baudoinia panamericana UAMH 10762]EMC91667.1 hypothetical protein BAUCODRAFT_79132 [Baudoinia panamericana UAMH 10762]
MKSRKAKDGSGQKTEAPDLAIVGDNIKLTTGDASSPGLLQPYARFRKAPINALQELGLHLTGSDWRSYEYVIGQPTFYPGFSENMKRLVMAQERLQKRIVELAQKRVEVELHEGLLEHRTRRFSRRRQLAEQLREVAEDWTDKMICKMDSRYFIRGAYYLVTQLLTRAYHQGIHVGSEEVVRLRKVAEEAAAKRQSIIFLPCHRSHVDYVALQVVCYRLGLALPTVVAGENLNFPVIGPFLQHAGAMWIRRSFGEDKLYGTLVQSYMDTLLQNGFNVECFIEGERSRTGKLLQPQFGILSYFLESVLSGSVQDAMVCPVSIQYDKVIEVDSYVNVLLGQPQPREDLSGFLARADVLSLKLGRVDVRFHEPWSLRGFIDEQTVRLSQSVANSDTTITRRRLLSMLGYKALMDINSVSVVMPTSLVGTVLLTLRGRGVGMSELIRRVDWLSDRIRAQGGHIAQFGGNTTEVVVDRALEVLGPKLVGRIDGLPEATFYAEDRFQLSFYRNMTIHLFVLQALVCVAVYTEAKHGSLSEARWVSYQELRNYVHFLSQLFRGEFIFPTAPLEDTLRSTLHGLQDDRVLTTARNKIVNNDIEDIALHPEELASGRENFDFYCYMIWPFVEASWLGTLSLFMLVPPAEHSDNEAWLRLRDVQTRAQLLGKTLYHQGDLSYYEAVNKEVLANAYTRSQEDGIIHIVRSRDRRIPSTVRLDPAWLPARHEGGRLKPEGKLWELCEQISLARREGRNRRDGATVRTRVLRLVELVAQGLFADAAATDVKTTPRRLRQRKELQTKALL